MKAFVFGWPVKEVGPSIGLLIGRLVFGGFMLVGHGWGKLMNFSEAAASFPDPLHIGSTASMASAIFAEVVCSALVILGVGTRLAVLPLIFTMGIAALVIHCGAPFFMGAGAAKEPALFYMAAFVVLFFTGAGRFSIDSCIRS